MAQTNGVPGIGVTVLGASGAAISATNPLPVQSIPNVTKLVLGSAYPGGTVPAAGTAIPTGTPQAGGLIVISSQTLMDGADALDFYIKCDLGGPDTVQIYADPLDSAGNALNDNALVNSMLLGTITIGPTQSFIFHQVRDLIATVGGFRSTMFAESNGGGPGIADVFPSFVFGGWRLRLRNTQAVPNAGTQLQGFAMTVWKRG